MKKDLRPDVLITKGGGRGSIGADCCDIVAGGITKCVEFEG